MPQNPLRLAIRDADRVEQELRAMFRRYIGSRAHPRGRVRGIYQQARAAMDSAYKQTGPRAMLRGLEIIENQRQSLYDVGAIALPRAVMLGRESARAQVAAYQESGESVTVAQGLADARLYEDAWRQPVEAQLARVTALIQSGAESELVIGDGPGLDTTRKGALQPAPVASELAFWLAMAVAAGFLGWIIGSRGPSPSAQKFSKQAIAAIDERTTDCCLRAHGQIVPLQGKFRLTGTPRFADRLDWVPFHWYCRTSVALYLARYDDGYTERMTGRASAELAQRKAGREEIHPAHATSRRHPNASITRPAVEKPAPAGGVFERVRRKAADVETG